MDSPSPNPRLTPTIGLFDRMLKNKYFIAFSKLKEFLVVLLFFFAFLKGPFTEPEIEVTYENLPSKTGLKSMHIIDSLNAVAIPSGSLIWLQPLVNRIISGNVLVINISNNLDKKVNDFELRVNGVDTICDVDIESDAANIIATKEEIAEYKTTTPGTAIFPGLRELPPNMKLTMYIFGKIQPPIFSPTVSISSSVEHSKCHAISKASGLAILLANNAVYVFAILLGFVLLIGLNRLRRQG